MKKPASAGFLLLIRSRSSGSNTHFGALGEVLGGFQGGVFLVVEELLDLQHDRPGAFAADG
jgi:hypothetical protein